MRRHLWVAAGIAWFAAVVTGFAWLAVYANTPGAAGVAASEWPDGSRIVLDTTRPTLVMLAHPRCTCTRASLGELAEVMARARQRPRGYVVFIKPGGTAVDWERTDLWRTASAIPDVTVVRDDDGVEAARFGAQTSGQVYLYDAGGRLLFSGGTTGARAHPGDNLSRATLLALLNHQRVTPASTSVFGCSLFEGPDPDRTLAEDTHGHHGR
jgi:hypothetical protein